MNPPADLAADLTDDHPTALPGDAFAAALAQLPGMGPARLVEVLRDTRPDVAWQRVLSGEIRRADRNPSLPGAPVHVAWEEVAARWDVHRQWDALQEDGIGVTYFGSPNFPKPLLGDPDPPGVLFFLGDLRALGHRRVAIIGTRQCTSYGRTVATQLGRDLAECGVCVVSGLALGIDGAAHQGALLAAGVPKRAGEVGPVGVAASGVDLPYPKKHTDLWRRVAAAGAVISETPPRRPAQSWRFPARNRIIAGLAEAVVVVESHVAGGSMLTVAAAADRGIDVLAVPGPVTSPASAGANQLLYEGLAPVRHAGDVLAAIGDFRPWPATACRSGGSKPPGDQRSGPASRSRSTGHMPTTSPASRPTQPSPTGPPRPLEPAEKRALDAIDCTATSTSVIADRTGLPLGALSVVLLRLEGLGLVQGQGTWWERCHGE